MSSTPLKATVIIAVYNDVDALRCVLHGLDKQTERAIEIIVTEDGEMPRMAEYMANQGETDLPLTHLTQADQGFRKTRAANRAIAAARAPYLIFIDGDCIPHPEFVASHLANAEKGRVCAGRRVHLGPRFSAMVKSNPSFIKYVINRLYLVLLAIPLTLDHMRNLEIGLFSHLVHRFTKNKFLSIIGCNFSCYREDLMKVNGYNEDLPGIGAEDGDLDLRLREVGIHTKNIKFLTRIYHLYHDSRRQDHEINFQMSMESLAKKQFYCSNGLDQHLVTGKNKA